MRLDSTGRTRSIRADEVLTWQAGGPIELEMRYFEPSMRFAGTTRFFGGQKVEQHVNEEDGFEDDDDDDE